MKLAAGRNGLVNRLLARSPGLHHQAAHPVTVYRPGKLLFGHRKARQHRRSVGRSPGHQAPDDPYRKNRKRFPGPEKRINMLLSLEPLVCFESITNGKKF
jgi:hypothetical protein